MRMKIRDVRNSSTVDTTMRPDEKVERAHIDTDVSIYTCKMALEYSWT